MTFKSSVDCDSCGRSAKAPANGGVPDEWVEITFRLTKEEMDQDRRPQSKFHTCHICAEKVRAILRPVGTQRIRAEAIQPRSRGTT